MATEVHVWVVLGAEAEYVRVHFTEVDPDLLGVLPLVDLLELVVVEADFSSAHIECDKTDVWIALRVAKVHCFARVLARVVHYIGAPAHTFALLFVIFVVFALLILISVEEWLVHHVVVVGLVVFLTLILLVIMLREQDGEVLQILLLAKLLLLFIHHALFFDSLAVLNKLVIKLVLDETIHHARTNNVVTFWHFIAHAASSHKFDHDRLRSLDPVSLELLITDSIEKHLVLRFGVRDTLALDHFQIAFMIRDLFSDLSVEARVQLCQGQLSLSGLGLMHGFELGKALTNHLGAIAQAGSCPLLRLEKLNLFPFNLAHPLIKFHQLLHLEQVLVPFNLSFLLWPDALQLNGFGANPFVEVSLELLQLPILRLDLALEVVELSFDWADKCID